MNLSTILQELQPVLISGLSVFLTLIIGLAANKAKVKFGLDIEARHREALHSALMSGAEAAFERGAGAGRDALIDEAIGYAQQSVPDAIGGLNPAKTVLRDLAGAKLGRLHLRFRE